MAHAIRVMQGLNGDGDSVSLTRTNKARVIAGNVEKHGGANFKGL